MEGIAIGTMLIDSIPINLFNDDNLKLLYRGLKGIKREIVQKFPDKVDIN